MIRRRLWTSLIGVSLVAVILLAINLATGNTPVLGLDLQGGVSVVLAPTERATGDDLLTIRDLIRGELEDRGIAEPDVRVEGRNIVVDLPGVKDQRAALEAVDVAGIVTLRPLVSPCAAPVAEGPEATGPPDSAAPGSSAPDDTVPASSAPDTTVAASSAPDDTAPASSAPDTTVSGWRRPAGVDTTAPPASSEPVSSGPVSSEPVSSEPVSSDDVPGSSEPVTTTTVPPLGPLGPIEFETGDPSPFTPLPPPPEDNTISLPDINGQDCVVGPVQRSVTGELTGFLFDRDSAGAGLNNAGAWVVNASLTDDGVGVFNSVASTCSQGAADCPTGQVAIVMDDVVQTTLGFQTTSFEDGVTITGDFSESEARDLARVINRGAFPIQVEARNVQTVSATLGKDSMRASVVAGLIGVLLVLGLLYFFYRKLIVVVLSGIAVWAMLIYSASALISQTTNYALTLAGVAGIVISIGVTVDSYVVYFERLKDEVRHGRTIRNSTQRSFKSTWRTILAADFVSLLAAVVLFILSVGSVRGFALYLGITTVCDVLVFYFFTRPAVALLADTGWLDEGDTFGLKEYE